MKKSEALHKLDTLTRHDFIIWLDKQKYSERFKTLLRLHSFKLTCLFYKNRENIHLIDDYINRINNKTYKKRYALCITKISALMDKIIIKSINSNKRVDLDLEYIILSRLYKNETRRVINRYLKD